MAGGLHGNALQAALCSEIGTTYSHPLPLPKSGSLNVASRLVVAGADINARGVGYGTALVAAASDANLQTVDMLLKQGALVNEIVEKHVSALAAAARFPNAPYDTVKDSEHVISLLLETGADVNLRNRTGISALHKAFEMGNGYWMKGPNSARTYPLRET